MAKTDIDELQISVTADTKEAVKAYKDLANALGKLRKMSKSDFGFANLSHQVKVFSKNTRGAIADVERLANAMERIKGSSQALRSLKSIENLASKGKTSNTISELPENGSVTVADPETADTLRETTEAVEDNTKSLKAMTKEVKRASTSWDKFTKNILNIVKYRMVRAILSSIAKAAKEGSDNLYVFLNAADSNAAKKMKGQLDSISSSFLQLKNTIGVTTLSLLASWKPIISAATGALINLGNAINIAIALLRRENTYITANTESIKKWSEAVNHAVQGFDELNVIAGNGDSNPMDMFEEKTIDMEDIGLMLKEATILGTLIALYATLKQRTKGLTGAFKDKNTSLEKQTSRVTADEKATENLAEEILGLATGAAAAYGAFKLLNDAKGILSPEPSEGLAGALNGLKDKIGELTPDPIGNIGTALANLKEGSEKDLQGVETAIGSVNTALEGSQTVAQKTASVVGAQVLGIMNSFKNLNNDVEGNQNIFRTWKTNIKAYSETAMGAIATMVNTSNAKLGSLITKLNEAATAYKNFFGVQETATSTSTSALPKPSLPTSDYAMEAFSGGYSGVTIPSSTSTSTSVEKNGVMTALETYKALTTGMEMGFKNALLEIGKTPAYQAYSTLEDAFIDAFPKALEWLTKNLPSFASWFMPGVPVGSFKADGGFVNAGQVFVAREAGPEMVGKIGSRSAVANNDQITSAIASAVYSAIKDANFGGNVNVTLEGDAKKMFRVVQSEARNYTRTTGNLAW